MTSAQIETNIKELVHSFSKDTFIYDLLLAYGQPKATINRLKQGTANLSKDENTILLKKKLYYKLVEDADLHHTIDDLSKDSSTHAHNPRFIIVTDNQTILSVDTKTEETLDVEIERLDKHYDFFLPWAGMEKSQHQNENPADVKAAEKMALLFDNIKRDNPDMSPEFIHSLNVFMARLLFCFFAEDTNIFEDGIFTNGIDSHTQHDGSDLDDYLKKLFVVLNTEESQRIGLSEHLNAFPYVGGSLFKDTYTLPKFTRSSRQAIIDSGVLDWAAINPDIFGSMMQAVITDEDRGSVGMHYTSVPNIMKVIEPLFLNDLYEEFEKAKGNEAKLNSLLDRLSKVKIFDPACGSGNFLIIAYKEIRRLEMKILKEAGQLALTGISLDQFYGIEIDDFAYEVAMLSLWLVKHQMSIEFYDEFGRCKPTLPLEESGSIACGNACQLDWEDICTKDKDDEIYLLGNPPYLGSRSQSNYQKKDMQSAFNNDYKSLDYVSCWFYLGAKYIKDSNAQLAFVTTNSITQGEQVALTWQRILTDGIEINFAYKDFKWKNNAKSNAGVTVCIIGLEQNSKKPKMLFNQGIKSIVSSISPYIVSGKTIYIKTKNNPLSDFPEMNFGNMPADGGLLLFGKEEIKQLLINEPKVEKWVKKLISAREYLNGQEKWCLWLEGCSKEEINDMPVVQNIIDEVRTIRLSSSRPQLAKTPQLFAQITQPPHKDFILIPRHSSENREYIPIGFFNSKYIAHDSNLIIAGSDTYFMGILSSKMHMVWIRAVCGRLETRFRYSKDVVYNNFPFPIISNNRKQELTECTFNILEEREKYSDKTLAELYNPDKMPDGLKEAHHNNDLAVERCYRSQPFSSDEQRLEYLFTLYEKMIEEENAKGSLFEESVKKKRKRRISA